jgi:hypothetical protein
MISDEEKKNNSFIALLLALKAHATNTHYTDKEKLSMIISVIDHRLKQKSFENSNKGDNNVGPNI